MLAFTWLGLPDDDALVGRIHHGITIPAAESRRERGKIGRSAIGADAHGCMRIGAELQLQRLLTENAAPRRGPAIEEPLVAGEAIDLRILRAGSGLLQGVVGNAQATEVGDVFTQGEVAID